jgi:hypothetical protein
MKLEVVVPDSDVDRVKRFYETLGWRMRIDYVAGEDFRLVQRGPCATVVARCTRLAGPTRDCQEGGPMSVT